MTLRKAARHSRERPRPITRFLPIRLRVGISFICDLVMHFSRAGATLPANCIDRTAYGDGSQPWLYWPAWLVRVPHAVDGQQHVLYNVRRHVIRPGTPTRDDMSKRRDRGKEQPISPGVTLLCGAEQLAPMALRRRAMLLRQAILQTLCNLIAHQNETSLNGNRKGQVMENGMSKRTFLGSAAAMLGAITIGGCSRKGDAATAETFEVEKTAEEWRAILTPEQYAVLREESTERAGTSALNAEHRKGTYRCAGCDLPVYASEAKFESGTGWPSFTAPIEGAVRTKEDRGIFGTRTEVHCRRCGGHLGHVFDDGPPPTGQRYCMNGVALKFVAA